MAELPTATRIRQLLGLPLSPDEQRDLRGSGPMYPEEAGPGIESREPRWSEKMAGLLFGDQRRSMGQQRFSDTVAGLAGLTPLGALDASGPQEAAMAILPGAGGRMGKEAMGAAKAGIKAYHGSPHSFERFELSPKTIGTGEGAQAYGHGLYFAGNENIARSYRDALAPGNKYTLDGTQWKNHADFTNDLLRQMPGGDSASNAYRDGAQTAVFEVLTNKVNPTSYVNEWERSGGNSEAIRGFRDAIPLIDKLAAKPGGHMYEVNINARPEQFLDWDKPLAQQGKPVLDAIKSFPDQRMGLGLKDFVETVEAAKSDPKLAHLLNTRSEGAVNLTGDQVYNTLASRAVSRLDPWERGKSGTNPAAATEALREAGIPGIQYLDAGSRGVAATQQARIAKMESDVAHLRGMIERPPAHLAGQDLSHLPAQLKQAEDALSTALAGSNITKNYVVFDDRLIDILRKYGIAGAAPLGGAAMLGGQEE